VDVAFAIAVALALTFAFTNGIHDASNAIATLVATRAASPLQAVLIVAVFNMLGPLLLGAAVADTIGGIVTVEVSSGVDVICAGLFAAVAWNVFTWAGGVPSSSGHALIGGLSAPRWSRAAPTPCAGAGSTARIRSARSGR
jgi:PiT family inorganic phosphate transporter